MTLQSVADSIYCLNSNMGSKAIVHYRYRRRAGQSNRGHGNNTLQMSSATLTLVWPLRLNGIVTGVIFRFRKQLSLVMHNICRRQLSAITTVLLLYMSTVDGIYTTLIPATGAIPEEENIVNNETLPSLVVCLPTNSTNCIKYVNSTRNGLIALNESLYPALKTFRGDYDYNLIERISPFWLKFQPPSNSFYNTMAALYMIIFCIGSSGNGLVIYMFLRCKSLRTSPYLLVLNLAISDFIIVVKSPFAVFNNYMRGPVLGDLGCRIYGFIGGLSGTASIGMLTIIALDRYSVVVNPLNPNRINNTTHYYLFWIIFVWLYALFFSSMPLADIGLSRYVPEGYFTTCSFDYLDTSLRARIFMFVFFVCAWLVPLSIICYCYFHILKVVISTRENIQSNKNKQKTEIRLAFIVLLVILLWFLAWTPYSIVAICGIFHQEEYLTPSRAMIPAVFCKTASCLNPFLYTISHKRFRHEMLRIFCNRKPLVHYSTTRSSYMTRSSRKQRQYDVTAAAACQYDGSLRRRDSENNFCHQRPYVLRRNIRSYSTTDSTSMPKGKFGRYTPRSSMMAEKSIAQYGLESSTMGGKSIIAGSQGSGVFIINERATTEPEEDVIFIVSDGVSAIRHSISSQVFVLSTDSNDGLMPYETSSSPTPKPLETSL
ncbi:opsin Rh4 isoform X1 [Stomoxys calcitrans]|uniref:opsin Rh4 isoform X1 n=2 Tax=Stomoxys calcitrans TaxID=35570 RepID=UPI0027E2710F|nr:opsin Rh4 isoform X1 [Stomoxys calcitrans]XP_059216593.1 opsin Rh4 isoform X1 [Stomoxys calcitrans]XP_059216594.1 opsin Rh4 isoform X1 [Stomoxys calcitrans]XP_059216595.1 opsin Rh4 isoform X1 [Stomoxys calcitrans]